jgi:hypothetical protein
LTTSASGNVGTFTAQPNASGSAAVWRTSATSPNDAHVHAVFSMSSGQITSSRFQGVIANKPATTANTFYLATFNVAGSKGTNYYGIELRRYSAGTLTTLFAPYATITGLNGSTAKWVMQLRTSRIDGGTTLLIQARAWQGTNPASPPAGCDWVTSGGISGSNYQSVAVTDYSPLAAGRGGLFLQGVAGTSFTGTYEQFEFRQLSAQTNTITNSPTVATTKAVTKPLTASALASTVNTIKAVAGTLALTITSTVTGTRAVAIARSLTTGTTVTTVRNVGKQVATSTGSLVSLVRARLLTIVATLTTGTSLARDVALNVAATVGTLATAGRTNLQTVLATLGTAVTAIVRKVIPEPPKYVQLTQRSTAQVGQTSSATIGQPSIAHLGQTIIAALRQPTTVRLPKE